MSILLSISVEYGGYISIIKFVIFLALFFLWFALVSWVHQDAGAVGRQVRWTAVIFATGAFAVVLWLLIPIFAVGMLLFLVAVPAAALAYVTHRNARVMDYDRILTADHIKSLFVSKQKKLDAMKGLLFITANNNEVPLPEPKTPEFFGYKAAYELFKDTIWRRASDLSFLPTPQDYRVTYQIDGVFAKQPPLAKDQMELLMRFVKHLGDLDINEKRKPQKGKFRILQGEDSSEWEVTTAGSTAGEQMLIKRMAVLSITRLTEIGLMPDQQEQLSRFSRLKQGVFIVSGPPKSGVTTTLYALLRNHDAFINSPPQCCQT